MKQVWSATVFVVVLFLVWCAIDAWGVCVSKGYDFWTVFLDFIEMGLLP